MPDQAKVTSFDAIAAFRSDLLVFLSQMRPALDEVNSEIARVKSWIQYDQRQFWQQRLRQHRLRLEELEAELFNAKLSQLLEASMLQQMAVRREREAVRHCEEKLDVLKKWDREIENRTDPMVKQIEQLQGFVVKDMTSAAAYLEQVLQALEAYASGGSSPAAGPENSSTPASTPEASS